MSDDDTDASKRALDLEDMVALARIARVHRNAARPLIGALSRAGARVAQGARATHDPMGALVEAAEAARDARDSLRTEATPIVADLVMTTITEIAGAGRDPIEIATAAQAKIRDASAQFMAYLGNGSGPKRRPE